jgi:hypothetical protein
MEKRLIKISSNKIFLTPEIGLGLPQTNLRESDLKFKTAEDIYFEVEVPNYDKSTGHITIHVTDYQPRNIQKFKEQKASGQVNFIHFRPFLWHQIERYLSVYTHSKLLRLGIVIGNEIYNESTVSKKSRLDTLKESGGNYAGASIPNFNQPIQDQTKTLEETGKIYFKDADFNDGYVAFEFKSKERKQTFNLKIDNTFLLKQFDAIKSYFPKVFGGRKQFNITVKYTLNYGNANEIVTTSEDIAAIDDNIIEKIKNQTVSNLTSTPIRNSPNKSLFTADDIFDSFHDGLQNGNILMQSGEDILNRIIEIKDVRNGKQLQFLSGAKQSANQKLRFTLKPLFGFLFFIEGDYKNHFCWELLDSHATYIWSFEKAAAIIQFNRIEKTINDIKVIGRDNYKKEFKNGAIDNDLIFHTIEHSNVNSEDANAFLNWKNKIEKVLV